MKPPVRRSASARPGSRHASRWRTSTSIINPPGAAATSAFMVNNSGVIVGAYRDANGVLHGYRRSPSGSYVTVDFPGAPDSQLTGINNLGETIGVYDLGSLASTRCPGPSCGAISFSLQNGHFSSFEDPAAAPGVTFAQSVNDKGQIAGFYEDTNGNPFGFCAIQRTAAFRRFNFQERTASRRSDKSTILAPSLASTKLRSCTDIWHLARDSFHWTIPIPSSPGCTQSTIGAKSEGILRRLAGL